MQCITSCNIGNINKNIYAYGSDGLLLVYLSGVCTVYCFVCCPKACDNHILISLDVHNISKFYPCT